MDCEEGRDENGFCFLFFGGIEGGTNKLLKSKVFKNSILILNIDYFMI